MPELDVVFMSLPPFVEDILGSDRKKQELLWSWSENRLGCDVLSEKPWSWLSMRQKVKNKIFPLQRTSQTPSKTL